MSRPIVTVPYALMRMTQVDWWIDWRGQGSERNDGNTKTVYNRAPIWRGQFSLALPVALLQRGHDAGAVDFLRLGRAHVLLDVAIGPALAHCPHAATETKIKKSI